MTFSQYSVNLGMASYELDLFGHVRSLKAAALENYFATEEARRGAQIALVAEVGNACLFGTRRDRTTRRGAADVDSGAGVV